MPSKRFVFAHLADAHVGAWPRDPAVREALRKSVLRALEVVEERDCAFLLISGDLFHTPVPEPAEVAPVAAALRRLVGQGRRIYVIYGSHDYVAERVSWLDVLAETGLFLRAAPEAVREEGQRWTLPFHVDEETGAAIAGISGRAHSLDRAYFAGVDSEKFRAHPGFKIFQFHAAVEEYLPEGLRDHHRGISRDLLPEGVDYYAAGHIHRTYQGRGPDGGLLINPGAVFGTSITDLRNAAEGTTHQGIVILTVEDGVPSAEFVRTAPKDVVRLFDVDVEGKTAEEARSEVARAMDDHAVPGALLFPHVRGTLVEGSITDLELGQALREASSRGAKGVHWDVSDLALQRKSELPAVEADIEAEGIGRWASFGIASISELSETERLARLRELLRELGTPKAEGEARHDYERARLQAGLRALGVEDASRPPL